LQRADIFTCVAQKNIEKMKVVARTQAFAIIPTFKNLQPKLKMALAQALTEKRWASGSTIMQENAKVDSKTRKLYVVESGFCIVRMMSSLDKVDAAPKGKRKPLTRTRSIFNAPEDEIGPGAYFGMLELVYGCPCQQTVIANSDVSTLSMSFEQLHQHFDKETLLEILPLMKRSVQIFLLQKAHPMLRSSTEADVGKLLDLGRVVKYDKWQTVLRRGEAVSEVCMLEEGTCIGSDQDADTLWENTSAMADCVEHTLPGDTFGTRHAIGKALGSRLPTTATIIAISMCTVLQIPISHVENLPSMKALQQQTSPAAAKKSPKSSPAEAVQPNAEDELKPAGGASKSDKRSSRFTDPGDD